MEEIRRNIPVDKRVAMFRDEVLRSPYWGLIRVTAQKAIQSRSEEDVLVAVQACERIRSRQLGELLTQESDAADSIEELRRFKRQLDPDSIVLSYCLTDEALVLLALGKDQHGVRVIPYQKREFEQLIKRLAQALADPASHTQDLARELSLVSKIVLPTGEKLPKGKKRIVVLPDGVLNLIPFDLLTATPETYRPLIQDVTVRVLPSLRFRKALHKGQPPSFKWAELVAVGDPIYAKVPTLGGLSQEEVKVATRGSTYLSYFVPLPETRTEVNAIAGLFKHASVNVLLGPQATESKVKQLDLKWVRYLHVATHGIVGGDVPGIGEPALVLGDEPGSDGFLKASEVETLRLNVDLAVLSACKTGSGELVRGEGVLGMSRAFLMAGAKSVVISLWEVESKATEDLMVSFYKQLLEGKDKAEALRLAKLELMGNSGGMAGSGRGIQIKPGTGAAAGNQQSFPGVTTGRQHPFYWAAFILVGR